jgi:TetR/AcrR family transcriptional repressor of nem operon
MRAALARGTRGITDRLARCIEAGRADGSLAAPRDAAQAGAELYQNWLGASLLAKITRDRTPLDTAMASTRQLLGLVATA